MHKKYLGIADDFRQKILDGTYKPGDTLPSLLEESRKRNVAKNVVIAAYNVLKNEGLVEARTGGETKVFDPKKPVKITLSADFVSKIDAKANENGMQRSEWLMSVLEEMV